MKIISLLTGLFIGGIVTFFLTKSFYHPNPAPSLVSVPKAPPDNAAASPAWNWPDSLDAAAAAPGSHKIVFEDSNVRILQVILEPDKVEPVHTHQWKSIMWFTQATPMTYYKLSLSGNQYIIQDSIPIPQMPPKMQNHGDIVEAEGPHAIKNRGDVPGIAYRVEFKKEFKPQ